MSMVLVEGQSFLAFIDSGASISTITEDLVEHLQFPIQTLNRFLNTEGTRGIRVPYLRYMEMHLQVPVVRAFDRDVLLLMVPNSPYGDRVSPKLGTVQIDMMLDVATEDELQVLGMPWLQIELATRLAGR